MHIETVHVTPGVWAAARALASATVWVTWKDKARGFRA